jgi:hypothetical protein
MRSLLCLLGAVLVSIASSGLAQTGVDDELAAIRERFTVAMTKQDETETRAQAPSKAAYLKELEKLRDMSKARSQLDALIEAEAALKAAATDAEPPPAKLLKAQLLQARASWDRASEAAIRAFAPARARLGADYDREIADLEQRYTRSGNVDAARKVRDARRIQLTVDANVDGPSTLFVRKDGLYWVNGGNAKPGATYVNGKKWLPRWGKPDQERGADKTDSYPLAMSSLDLKVDLIALTRDRGQEGLEQRTPIDVKQNATEIQISIPDPESGQRWYKLIFRKP